MNVTPANGGTRMSMCTIQIQVGQSVTSCESGPSRSNIAFSDSKPASAVNRPVAYARNPTFFTYDRLKRGVKRISSDSIIVCVSVENSRFIDSCGDIHHSKLTGVTGVVALAQICLRHIPICDILRPSPGPVPLARLPLTGASQEFKI